MEPAKRMPGYANFSVADPPLKLVLIENPDVGEDGTRGKLNHLGIEVESPDLVTAAGDRLGRGGLEPRSQRSTTCCYAVQDKVWVHDPDGAPWEVYTVLADAPAESGLSGDRHCCSDGGAGGPEAVGGSNPVCC